MLNFSKLTIIFLIMYTILEHTNQNAVSARMLPTRSNDDKLNRLRELLREVSVFCFIETLKLLNFVIDKENDMTMKLAFKIDTFKIVNQI